MAQIRPETEVDRTKAAIAAEGLTLPFPHATVEIAAAEDTAGTSGGQRLVTLLVNELARMKGVVTHVQLAIDQDTMVLAGTPLAPGRLSDGLAALVDSLNVDESEFRASMSVGTRSDPDVRVRVGGSSDASTDIVVGSDAWRALFGRFALDSDWQAASPVGPAVAAALTAVEVFKRLVSANGGADSPRAPRDFAYSAFNYGTDADAAAGPDVSSLRLANIAIVGCGAGGSAAAYILAMHPRLEGVLCLIEPGVHKPSNLNRYLATNAHDVHQPRHKLGSLVDHLARFAPSLALDVHARPWEQLDQHPWELLISAVDTIEARWQIQRRAVGNATIVDLGVDDLLYSVLRSYPGGRCLFCKHPYDAELALKQRAARWGVPVDLISEWSAADRPVDREMIGVLARTQGRDAAEFAELLDLPFGETPRLIECGSTSLQADVPSQAPILPLATSAVGAIAAAEIMKDVIDAQGLDNWLAHDLRRNPRGPWLKQRGPIRGCPHHQG